MSQTIRALVVPAVLQRLNLLVNHVLFAEPAATQRLCPHAGRWIQINLTNWPALLPALPRLLFQITPAGLLEWRDEEVAAADMPTIAADLVLGVDAGNPALLMARLTIGERPAVDVQGDAQLAADVQWLADNLRWDLEADLSRLLGPLLAHQVVRFGAALAAGLRSRLKASAGSAQAPTST